MWSERTFIVIDINYYDYDSGTAHKAKTILLDLVLRQYGKKQDWVLIMWPKEDEPLSAHLGTKKSFG